MKTTILVILSSLTGCSDEPPEEVKLATASHDVTWESAAMLGPHRFDAAVTLTEFERDSINAVEVRWGDWDSFEVINRHNGELRTRVLFINGDAWQGDEDRMRETDNRELYRRDLATSWNMWDEALSPFRYVMKMEKTGETVFEGRPALVYAVFIDPLAETPKGSHMPVSLEGTVTLDEGTAVRLAGDVRGVYQTKSGGERAVAVKVVRSEIGVVPDLVPP